MKTRTETKVIEILTTLFQTQNKMILWTKTEWKWFIKEETTTKMKIIIRTKWFRSPLSQAS